jgi:predicted transcriptional regulator
VKNPCEIVVKYFLPACRSLIAKKLIDDHKYTQAAVADKLGTTQAAISFYLSSRRGEKYIAELETNPHVQQIINHIVEGLSSDTLSANELMLELCALCRTLRNNDLICNMHREYVDLPEICDACTLLNIGLSPR